MAACNIRRVGDRVVMTCNGRGVAMHYSQALAFYLMVKRLWTAADEYDRTGDHAQVRTDSETLDSRLTVHRTGLLFTFELQHTIWFECPYTIALQLLTHAYRKAIEIEQEVKYLLTAEGQAILWESKAPFGLTGHPQIIEEAAKLLPGAGNIPSEAAVGTPGLIHHPLGGSL